MLALGGSEPKFYELATTLENALNDGLVNEHLADATRLYCAFSYSISGEYAYKKLLEQIRRLGSRFMAFDEMLSEYPRREFASMIMSYCDEKYQDSIRHCSNITKYLDLYAKEPEVFSDYFTFQTREQADTFIDLVIATRLASNWLVGAPEQFQSKQVAEHLQKMYKAVRDASLPPWFNFLSLLYISLIQREIETRSVRTILENHSIDPQVARTLAGAGLSKLWLNQVQSCERFLDNEDLLLSTKTGTGKTTFGLLALAAKRNEPGLSVYAAPTRVLAYQISNKVKRISFADNPNVVKVVTKEEPVEESSLRGAEVVVGTYEKIDGLIREKLIEKHNIKLLIVDECHTIADTNRGVTLDFLLARFKKTNPTQRLLLSAAIPEADLANFAQWSDSVPPQLSEWRRTELEEFIHYDGRRYPIRQISDALRHDTAARKSDPVMTEALAALKKGKMVLIVVATRKEAEDYAKELKATIKSRITSKLAVDENLKTIIREKQRQIFPEIKEQVENLELVVPKSIEDIRDLLAYSVAFHHAGMPREVRSLIDRWIEDKLIGIIVATSTLEMGVDFPVDEVLIRNLVQSRIAGRMDKATEKIPDYTLAKYVSDRYLGNMQSSYRNAIGRAGRASFAERGESIYFTSSREDLQLFKRMLEMHKAELPAGADLFFLSALMRTQFPADAKRAVAESHGRFLSALIGIIGHTEGKTLQEITQLFKQTWIWHKITTNTIFGPDRQSKATALVENELYYLKSKGFVSGREDKWWLTRLGYLANDSLISPLSLINIIDFLGKVETESLTKQQRELVVLYAACLPYEIANHKPDFRRSAASQDVILRLSDITKIPVEKNAAFKVAILKMWIDGIIVEDIIHRLSLDSSDFSFVSSDLPVNVGWILRALNSIAGNLKETRNTISDLITFVEMGSRSELEISLRGIPHLGRNSVISICKDFAVHTESDLKSLSEAAFLSHFRDKPGLAKDIYNAIRERAIPHQQD